MMFPFHAGATSGKGKSVDDPLPPQHVIHPGAQADVCRGHKRARDGLGAPATTPSHTNPALMSPPSAAFQAPATSMANRRGAGFGPDGGARTQRRTSTLRMLSKMCHPAADRGEGPQDQRGA
jgi:hypothetical protein